MLFSNCKDMKKSTSQRDAFEFWILNSEFIFLEHCLLNRRRRRSLLKNDRLLKSCLNYRKVLNSYLSHQRVWSMSCCCCFCYLSCWKNCWRVLNSFRKSCLNCRTVWSSWECCWNCYWKVLSKNLRFCFQSCWMSR